MSTFSTKAGKWGLAWSSKERSVSKSWGLKQGFYVHPTKFMQALFLDSHAKSTKFSRTLGTGNDDQQWTPWPQGLNDVNLARKALQTDAQVRAVYGD